MKCEYCGGIMEKVNPDYPPLTTYYCEHCDYKLHSAEKEGK